VEVGCSTFAKAADEVVRKVTKGLGAGSWVLVVIPDRARVLRTIEVLAAGFPSIRLWRDAVGILWRSGRAAFGAYTAGRTKAWAFTKRRASSNMDGAHVRPRSGPPVVEPTDPFRQMVRPAIDERIATG